MTRPARGAPPARRWWAIARHTADASWDIDVKVWVRGTEALFDPFTARARKASSPWPATPKTYQNITNVRLHEPISTAKQGGHNEALNLTTQTLAGLDPGYRSHMILHTARAVLNTVPMETRALLPAISDYRAAISPPTPT